MDAEGSAAKLSRLESELAAKSSRVVKLEARVSDLEAENAGLRKALAEATGRTGEEDPKFVRFAAGFRGIKHKPVGKLGGSAACGITEVSGGEDEAAVDANKGRNAEEGVVAALTPPKRVVTSESEDEADVEHAEGSDGSNREDGAGLEDDDVSVTPQGKKRRAAARVVTSDSEDDGVNGGEVGSVKDDADGQDGGAKPSRKRGLCGISDSEDEDVTEGVHVVVSKSGPGVVATQVDNGDDDEDDMVPISQMLKKMRKGRVSEDDADDKLSERRRRSAPTTRRSARLVKNQSKGGRAISRVNKFVEPKEHEESEDDVEEDDDMEGFIHDEESSENGSDSSEESRDKQEVPGTSVLNEESSSGLEESDPVADYASVMARIGRRKKAKDWKFEGDMLAAFAEHPELCLKAVCALYRKQTQEEQLEKAALVHNKEGFNHIDARRGSTIAEFLLDGDWDGPLKKTIPDLEKYDSSGLAFCHRVASNYSKQLFAIYENKEDPYFYP